MHPPTRILAPVDLESIAWEALQYAGWLGRQSGAIVDLFYALSTNGSEDRTIGEEHYAGFISMLTYLCKTYSSPDDAEDSHREPIFIANMIPGNPVERILDFAERGDHDVIIMGPHLPAEYPGADAPRSRRGGVTEQIVKLAHTPVLVVPAPRAEDPRELRYMV